MNKPILCLDTHELAWAAGFFDGEGSTCLRRRGSWMELCLQVPQSGDQETLKRFQKAVGERGKIGGPWKYKRRMLPAYRWEIYGQQAREIIAMLWPFLSGPKRAQADKALAECKVYFDKRALHGKGPAKLTREQARDLRDRHAQAKAGRMRVPRGWVTAESSRLGLSVHTIMPIVNGRGYNV